MVSKRTKKRSAIEAHFARKHKADQATGHAILTIFVWIPLGVAVLAILGG